MEAPNSEISKKLFTVCINNKPVAVCHGAESAKRRKIIRRSQYGTKHSTYLDVRGLVRSASDDVLYTTDDDVLYTTARRRSVHNNNTRLKLLGQHCFIGVNDSIS
jgi:hypothetical protein